LETPTEGEIGNTEQGKLRVWGSGSGSKSESRPDSDPDFDLEKRFSLAIKTPAIVRRFPAPGLF
jgi:hypothetical protein